MQMPKPGDRSRKLLEDVGEQLAGDGAKLSSMFGMPALKIGTKVFAGLHGDDMTVKLPPGALDEALKLKGVGLFEPMPGRAMREWAQVPPSHAKRWPDLARQALTYVRGS